MYTETIDIKSETNKIQTDKRSNKEKFDIASAVLEKIIIK